MDDMLTKAKKKFNELDADGNGVLEGNELNDLTMWSWAQFHPGGVPLTEEAQTVQSAKLIKKLDTNGDGMMDFDEFSGWFRRATIFGQRYEAKHAEDRLQDEEGTLDTEAASSIVEEPRSPKSVLPVVLRAPSSACSPEAATGSVDVAVAMENLEIRLATLEEANVKHETLQLVHHPELSDKVDHAVECLDAVNDRVESLEQV